jgi:predicted amidophosphoribosyltransferase
MTLISCKTCNAQIAKEAKTCPHCGATNGEAFKVVRFAGLIYLGLIVLAFYWLWGLMSP